VTLNRGTVVLVELDPTLGHEQRGVRPCIAVSDLRKASYGLINDVRGKSLAACLPARGDESFTDTVSGAVKRACAVSRHPRALPKVSAATAVAHQRGSERRRPSPVP
jgi:hypothetical protein